MNFSRIVFGTVLVAGGLAFGAIPALTPVPQSTAPGHWWMKRHAQKMDLVRKGGSQVVFIGDSITHFWEGTGREVWDRCFGGEPYRALNLGYSADRTEHVLWRIANGELDGYEAKCIVLMIGTNNSGHHTFEQEPPADTVAGIHAILEAIRAKQPRAKIVLVPIFPRGANATDVYRVRNNVVNTEIRKFADGRDIWWCDFTDQFLTADGRLPAYVMPDRLHPGLLGYEIWAAAVLPMIEQAVFGDGKRPVVQRFAGNALVCDVGRMNPWEAATYPESRVISPNKNRGTWWWIDRVAEKRAQIVSSQGAFDLVLFGDSITHFWERPAAGKPYPSWTALTNRYSVLNLGYGGDHTETLMWRGEYGELDGYKAKCVMLMIGTNNRNKPEETARGIRAILDLIARKQPQATTLLLPIFPRGENDRDAHRIRNAKINELIRPFADGKKVLWCDFNAKLVDAKGDTKPLMNDRLHPNAAGYDVWLEAVTPQLKAIIGK